MTDFASRVAALSSEKRALLARRLVTRRSAPSPLEPLPRQVGVNVFRTSFAQERLWFLEQVAPGSATYNVGGVYRAVGRLDLDALSRSVRTLVARHESFRTTFVATDGVPRQVVSPGGAASMSITDLRSGEGEHARTAALREMRRPFDVARGPLLRVAVFVLGQDHHMVAVTMHHLVADAWSMEIFVRELALAYRAFVSGRTPELATPRLQYADHAEWQRTELDRWDRRDVLTAYWRQQLRDVVYPDVPAGDRLAFRGAAVVRELPGPLVETLRTFVRREGVTLFVVMLAAWLVQLARRVGRTDVTVITPVANRERPEVSEIIGFFVNLVALRATWSEEASFRSLVHRVKEIVRGALVHQDLPFEILLDELRVERNLARPPLSPYAFAVEQSIDGSIVLPDVKIESLEIDVTTSKTDLALIVREHAREITVRLERNRDLYDARASDRLLGELISSLERVLASPERPLRGSSAGCSDSLAAASRRPPQETSSRMGSDDVTVWPRFAMQAARTPTAIAVRAGGAMVTYAGLAARAVGVAARLASAGVEAGSIVAVWGERGVGWLSTLLGIWRLGGVYLPLDPRRPQARITQVVGRSGARVVAAGRDVPAALKAAAVGTSWSLLPIDDAAVEGEELPRGSRARVAGSDLAYVLYTSGSMGDPKGVLIEHAALLNHLEAKCALLRLSVDDRVAQTAAASFDIAIWQALAALLTGGVVEVVPDDFARDPVRLASTVAAAGVTVLQVVPAMLRALVEAESTDDIGRDPLALDGLRWLVVTGEELAPALCRAWLTRHPMVPLVNAYGPTECADDVTHQVIRTPPAPDTVRVPIGRPIAGVTLRVLDAALQPVVTGADGELCVSGIAVGRGYLDDPERTATAFVSPDPFDGRPASRLYRTGDRGRERVDGTFECLGRLDAQVKIRGQRVEPGEVEAVLRTHPAVREAAVVARTVKDGALRLAAYVVGDEVCPPSSEDLRRYVAERLPDAMVPSTVVPLVTMPLDANGKLDRRGLPDAPAAPLETARGELVIGSFECRLAEIWRAVLGVEVRSVADDFFALGGDSLTSLRVAALARRAGLVITPQQIFEHRTIGALASVIVAASPCETEQGLVTGEVKPTPVQLMFLDARLPEPDHYNLSLLLEVSRAPAPPALAMAVEHVLRHHDALRLRVRSDVGGWWEMIADLDGELPFSQIDLSAVNDDELAPSIESEATALQSTLNLAVGPLIRVALFDLGPRRSSRLLVVVHHLACDVVSLPILLEDLATVYDQLSRAEPVALPAKTASFQAWARALDEYARAPARLDDLAWWQRECADPGAKLAREKVTREVAVADVEHVRLAVARAETDALLQYVARRGVSIEVVLATALVTAVTDGEGGDALLVYLERHGRSAGRDDLDVSRTVGWFTAVFPVRLEVAAGRRPEMTLTLIDQHLREIPDGGVGYGALWCLGDESASALRALPRPEISLNYLGRSDPPAGIPWRLAPESPGREHGRGGLRPTILDLTAHLERGRLVVDWAYDSVRLRRCMVARVATRAIAVMRRLVEEAGHA